jgi:putative ABC transport system substrate-binding protein
MIRRRDVITIGGASIACWPCLSYAQSSATPIIGFLNSASAASSTTFVSAFLEGLSEFGYFEGQNVKIEYRWAEGQYERLNMMAAELATRKVNIIAATGGAIAARAAKAASMTIPILFISGPDPVKAGLVASYSRPGGNVTGVTVETTEMIGKRLEMLLELVPKGTKVAMLVSSASTVEKFESEFTARNGLTELKLGAGKELDRSEYETQFEAAVKAGAGALLVSADPFFTDQRKLIVELATKHALPAIFPWRQYTTAGGLASYGPSISEAYRQIGRYAGRILKGAKPGDLPVQAPAVFELTINLKTARALGLQIPRIILSRVNEFIE